MRSRTLASERTRYFYAKLKRPSLFSWYLINLGNKINRWHRLSSAQKQYEFKIDQIAFFKKHFWYHFNMNAINGWIPAKHFRKNYCRLQLPKVITTSKVNSELASVIMLCTYVRPNLKVDSIIEQYQMQKPRSVNDLFMMIASRLGRFQNVPHKSSRRIRNQIRHQRPVVMKISHHGQPMSVVISGFNRRVFMYVTPQDSRLHLITRQRLLKAWRKCNYQAFSC